MVSSMKVALATKKKEVAKTAAARVVVAKAAAKKVAAKSKKTKVKAKPRPQTRKGSKQRDEEEENDVEEEEEDENDAEEEEDEADEDEHGEDGNDEEEEEDEEESKPKRKGRVKAKVAMKMAKTKVKAKAAAKSASKKKPPKGTAKAVAELERRKKAAVKVEDYAEALRLKEEIAAIIAGRAAKEKEDEDEEGDGEGGGAPKPKRRKVTGKTKAPAKGKAEPNPKKRAGASPKTASPKKKAAKELKEPDVKELPADPFFEDATPKLLSPGCLTTCEREAIRAVLVGNAAFLRRILGLVPLFTQRDLVSRQTALHFAIERCDWAAMVTLSKEASAPTGQPSGRQSSMATQGTGEMNVLTLGFATGKIGAARGGREMNNALVDAAETPEPLPQVIARAPLQPAHLKLLMNFNIITTDFMPGRGRKNMKRPRFMPSSRGGNNSNLACTLESCLEPAMLHGQLAVVKVVLKTMQHFGVSQAHLVAAGVAEMPDNLQGRSVTSKLRFGGEVTPVHIAAMNPDVLRLEHMLKLAPSAVTQATKSGLLPVHVAACCDGPGPLKHLLSEWGADRRAAGPEKRTPLHLAAAAGRRACVNLLMGGADGPAIVRPFTKEIRTILLRQKMGAIKIGADGMLLLSRLLVDLLSRTAAEASKKAAGAGAPSGVEALSQAAKSVLKGPLAKKIADRAKQAAGLPKAESGLVRKFTEVTEDTIQAMFEKIDKNGDGKLAQSEIQDVFKDLGTPLKPKDLKEIEKEMDADGSGEITLEEFTNWMEAGSDRALALRRHLVVRTGAMDEAEVAEAEAEIEEDLLDSVDKLAFDATALLKRLFKVAEDAATVLKQVAFASAMLECVCTKVLEVSANSARSMKKTTIGPEHVLNSIRANQELQGLYQADSVVMNSLMLPDKDKAGYTALHAAAEAGHVACVEALVACGADVNAAGPDRKPALALAAERGRTGCLRKLLEANARLEAADKRKRTPLLLAVRAGHTVEASILLNRGANPNAADDSGNTVAHYAASFGWKGCLELLHQAKANLSAMNAMKLAPITAALQKGHKSCFRRLLEMGIDVNFRDADGSTLLLSCLGTMNRLVYEEVSFMMSRKADPTLSSSQRVSPLHRLASSRLTGGNTFYTMHPNESPRLEWLQGWKARPLPPPEEEHGNGDDEDEDENEEETGAKKKPEKAKNSSISTESIPEHVHQRGLHQMSDAEKEAVFRLGFNHQQWHSGENPTTPWEQLDDAKKEATARLGLDATTWACRPVKFVTGVRNKDGTIPVTEGFAISASEDGMVSIRTNTNRAHTAHVSMVLREHEDEEKVWSSMEHLLVATAKALVGGGAVVNDKDAGGVTPLTLALQNGHNDLALFLLESGADPNHQVPTPDPAPHVLDPKKVLPPPKVPLNFAANGKSGYDSLHGMSRISTVVATLLKKGASVQEPGEGRNRYSPLIAFISQSDYESATVLFEAGADPTVDLTGRNALHAAAAALRLSWQSETTSMELFRRWLTSEQWGAKLMAEFTTTLPHVTPLQVLVSSFAGFTCNGSSPEGRAKLVAILLQYLKDIPEAVDLSQWSRPPEDPTRPSQPASNPLGLLCGAALFADCAGQTEEVVKLLCQRGVDPNGSVGSPAALHTLITRMGIAEFATSRLVKVLLPLTDLGARLPVVNDAQAGNTLLIYILRKFRSAHEVKETVKVLLHAQCDPNQADESECPRGRRQCPLHEAARLRDERLVELLIAGRADPDKCDKDSRTPLHTAVANAATGSDCNFNVEEVLLRAGANVKAQDAWGFSPLHYAFIKEETNGTFNFDGVWFEVKGEMQQQKFFWTQKAWNHLRERVDPIETISSLCAVTGVDVNVKDQHGMAPLHLAALRGASIAALKLLSAGARLEEEFKGNAPLGLAIQVHPDMAVLLMQRSACVTTPCTVIGMPSGGPQCTGVPESFFSLAVRQVAGAAPPQAQQPQFGGGGFGFNPGFHRRQQQQQQQQQAQQKSSVFLGAALAALDCGFPHSQALDDTISSGQFMMLLTLIPKVGDAILQSQRFHNGHNLLHRLATFTAGATAQEAFTSAGKKLLERGVPLDVDDNGRTPLHNAAESGHLQLLRLMLAHPSADAAHVQLLDRSGLSALGLAFGKCFCPGASASWKVALQMADALVKKGASAKEVIVEALQKVTLLMLCIGKEQSPISFGSSADDPRPWPLVLFPSETPNVMMQNLKGQTCLTLAARARSYSLPYLWRICKWARDGGVLVELFMSKDSEGKTALMHAVEVGNVGFVDCLLAFASKVSRELLQGLLLAQASDGRTAIMMASYSPDSVGVVCFLLRWMDDAVLPSVLGLHDSLGRTALMHAVLQNNVQVVQALVQGRPLQPPSTKVVCPQSKMAGDRVKAKAMYEAATLAPRFTVQWLTKNCSAQLLQMDDDPIHGVQIETGSSGGGNSSVLSDGTAVTVTDMKDSKVQVSYNQNTCSGWVHEDKVAVGGGSDRGLTYTVELMVPPGTGPGVEFEVKWTHETGGPGCAGFAKSFASSATSRVPASVLREQDKQGRTALHLCVCPLPFGSYESAEILLLLVKGGVPLDTVDQDGNTAVKLARGQRSGKLFKLLVEAGASAPGDNSMEVDETGSAWPQPVDLEADSERMLKEAEEARRNPEKPIDPPVENDFPRPSTKSQVAVALGEDDKQPLDLVMTKVDLSKCPITLNVFYRMQVLHETNQNNYFLFTRWGRIGDRGQFQTTPFESLEKAAGEFRKIFKSKAGNDWAARGEFVKKPLKYQLHELKYPTGVTAKDALRMGKWTWPPATTTPLELQPFLNTAASRELLESALKDANIEKPLGLIKRQPLEDARELLKEIDVLVKQKVAEERKAEPSGDTLQELGEQIAQKSSRIYELVPVRNFQHTNVAPINTPKEVKKWFGRLDQTDDVAVAARILLGAQSCCSTVCPTDYIFRALRIRALPLAHDSPELQLLERYINNTQGDCKLFTGEGAVPLPELQEHDREAKLPRWQAIRAERCYTTAVCDTPTEFMICVGFTYKQYAKEGDAICVRELPTQLATSAALVDPSRQALWIRPTLTDGTQVLRQLTKREAASKIANIYSVDRQDDSGKFATPDPEAKPRTLLWHGSGMANAISILSNGLRIKPPGAVLSGSAFGNGVYFANAFSKSRGYSPMVNGVGFMLLCEVDTGRTLESSGFTFQQSVREARIQKVREDMGLDKGVKPSEHPELREAIKEIDRLMEDVEDVSGTGCDSFHYQSPGAPNPQGSVVHPEGYLVPCGEIIGRSSGGQGGGAYDEIIVYDTSRVRLRYVVELRDQSTPGHFKQVPLPKPGDEEMTAPLSDDDEGSDD